MATPDQYPLSKEFKAQVLPYPPKQSEMHIQPFSDLSTYKAAGKLQGKTAIITGGATGIGRAISIAFVKEGAEITIVYNSNDEDADETKRLCEANGGKCLIIKTDVSEAENCRQIVAQTLAEYGKLDILVNNAAYQMSQKSLEEITEEQLTRTFRTNIFGYFFMAQAALPHLQKGSVIINTGSIVGKTGIPILIDYSATKGAVHAFTKSLALNLGERGIRVNCVIPGPVWTPNITATMPPEEINNYGHETVFSRPGQPEELAPMYVMLASDDSSFMTGSLIEITGGKLSSDS
ncbi:SDR family oxidoreductase [Mucilaginibacter robiniae]|uniref:SDR family oxidoreductase n=1 Tax=Mucilaginibacter robiniae TaxID=2728022 RepID=A0A7L5E3C2_9SPHI|nr:SDR family oxidoreductase [Mucilaginibacter robiniae]QJD94836.1 SDR family oxidoreductase [Mucilaginibacter robiniae]